MFHKPAHKSTTAGQVVRKEDISLNDYIERKEQAYKKKLTFDEWWDMHGDKFPLAYPKASANLLWNAAQENV